MRGTMSGSAWKDKQVGCGTAESGYVPFAAPQDLLNIRPWRNRIWTSATVRKSKRKSLTLRSREVGTEGVR